MLKRKTKFGLAVFQMEKYFSNRAFSKELVYNFKVIALSVVIVGVAPEVVVIMNTDIFIARNISERRRIIYSLCRRKGGI